MDFNKLAMIETAKNDQARSSLFNTLKKLGPEFILHFTGHLLLKELDYPNLSVYEQIECEFARQLLREFAVDIINMENEKE